MKVLITVLLTAITVFTAAMPSVLARPKEKIPQIIYIPHDNRPISDKQTAEVAAKLGYKIIVPPTELLGNRTDLGNPEKLWEWLEENTDKKETDAAVISSDALLYGSLVGSRKHNYSEKTVLERADRFKDYHKENPKVKLYVFGSIMRTPKSAEASGHEEPEYYRRYGSDIFRYTLLKDKAEVEGLTKREQKESAFLEKLIPEKDLQDWLGRRAKNYNASTELIRLTRANTFNYMVLGRDDNAPYSATHMESRHLAASGSDLDKSKFQAMAGIDEMGMLLLTRAVNEMKNEVPFVFVRYNWGRGEYTVPAYSDERISASIKSATEAAGGMLVKNPKDADLVLTVNTNPNGKTYEGAARANDGEEREGTNYFVDIVKDYLGKGYPVAIADVSYANGADNALMEKLRQNNLLFKLRAYAGWNTPTNSTGFVIGAGLLSKYMTAADREDLLLTRYLDDWAYQANVRNIMARQLTWLRGEGVYGSLDDKREAVEKRSSMLMARFLKANFPKMKTLEDVELKYPWNRLFEADVIHHEHEEINYFKRK